MPSSRSKTHAPRTTGEVVVPFAVTFSTAACVSTPPRTDPGPASGSGTVRIATPSTPGTPYSFANGPFSTAKSLSISVRAGRFSSSMARRNASVSSSIEAPSSSSYSG